jgi:iron(III) transport system substrate-binding protein
MKARLAIYLGLLLLIAGSLYVGVDLEKRLSKPTPDGVLLTIYSTTDTDVFYPVIQDFRTRHPTITIRYELLDALPLYDRVIAESSSGETGADLILSSAMDLQVKLANNGYAAPHISSSGDSMPGWARWRNEAFGVTFEPAVMVFSNRLMAGRPLPQTRSELLKALRTERDFWRGRVGTYDITKSSVGYLLASQDVRRSSEFGMLLDAFGEAEVQVSENTSSLLDHIENGNIAVGYNLLGSYARARLENGADISIIYPQDYTLAVSRTAIILRSSHNPATAHLFLEYLLSARGQKLLSEHSYLSAVRPAPAGPDNRLGFSESQVGLLRPISLGPGLLVYLDPMKRESLLQTWNEAMKLPPQQPTPTETAFSD